MKRYEFKSQSELLAATILLIKAEMMDSLVLNLEIDQTNPTAPTLVANLSAEQEALLEKVSPGFVLIQEGGSSTEHYIHAHGSLEDAQDDRISCAQGAYRTTPVMEISPALSALGEDFYEAAEQLLYIQDDLTCVEVPDNYGEQEDDGEDEGSALVERPAS